MSSIFQSLLLVIAGSTQRELARQVKYLKVENQILRGKLPERITITPKERERLLKFGAKLGKALKHLLTIVTPRTFLRWIREAKKDRSKKPAKRGRPRTAAQIRKLILKMARENNWGYSRIMGELKKLKIKSITRTTVRNILKEAGLDPAPDRGEATWDEFLKQHASSLWQIDFFSQRILTLRGIRQAFVIAYLHVKTRRVILSPATLHPDEQWVTAQAEAFVSQARSDGLPVAYVIHDRDSKFTKSFDQALKRKRSKTVKIAHCAPNMQAYVERVIQTLRHELLDHFLIFGTQHLDHLGKTYLDFYHRLRPHQGLNNVPPVRDKSRRKKSGDTETISLADIRCEKQLGGLLKSYSRRAA
jgi:putative transposase